MLKEFGMKDSRLKYVPLAPSIQLTMDIQFPPIEMKYYYIIVCLHEAHLVIVKHMYQYIDKTSNYNPSY
jgi:hypothetical protein